MIKIAAKLIEFGMDYQYEHNGSEGESIVCFQLDIEIYTHQGTLYFKHENQKDEFKDEDKSFRYLTAKLHDLIVAETSSF
ncbi:hypothetical protein [Lacinutrix sp. Hel_I_90]|uniref:hypothetical protein n=1 Tax=Lacinutrix sp. Hel_I_90 TaxID=1249999 RepID=UPI0005CA0E3B|nr:hypothetical protein [Lacinutrix sp. Hel_I_90]